MKFEIDEIVRCIDAPPEETLKAGTLYRIVSEYVGPIAPSQPSVNIRPLSPPDGWNDRHGRGWHERRFEKI